MVVAYERTLADGDRFEYCGLIVRKANDPGFRAGSPETSRLPQFCGASMALGAGEVVVGYYHTHTAASDPELSEDDRLWVALTGCAAANAGPAPGTRAPAAPVGAAAPVDAAAPWPNVVRLALPPERRECSNGGNDPRLEWRDVGGQLEPVPSDGSPAAIAPLPFEAPAELSTTTAAAIARSVVASDACWKTMSHDL